ncbi:MAG TPA: hypothetical protein PKW45_16695 [Bryobacteraceae bacterium]|nr:hypothetical protein [Bryobacteraceae bacterium]
MKKAIGFLLLLGLPLAAQEYKIAVVSGLHAHVWSHLKRMLKNDVAQFVGFAENIPELVEQAKKALEAMSGALPKDALKTALDSIDKSFAADSTQDYYIDPATSLPVKAVQQTTVNGKQAVMTMKYTWGPRSRSSSRIRLRSPPSPS